MKRKTLKFFAAMAIAAVTFAANANAATVTQSLFFNQTNLLSDNSAEYLLNLTAPGTYTTDGGGTIVDVGDRLRGWFDINTVEDLTGGGGTNSLGLSSGNNEFTGIFDIAVLTKAAVPGGFTFTFGPSGFLASPSAMLETYESVVSNYARTFGGAVLGPDDAPGAVKEEALLATATDGSLYWSFGYTGPGGTPVAGEGWTAFATTDDISLISIIPAPGNGGTANFALNLISNPAGVPLGLVPSTFGGFANLNGSGNLLGLGGASTPADIFDDFDVVIKPVPEPSTFLLFGAGLIGVGFAARRRFQK